MVPPDRKAPAFYRITGVPAPSPHQTALMALAAFLDRVALRLRAPSRRARTGEPQRRR
jgi:hypothetical protein